MRKAIGFERIADILARCSIIEIDPSLRSAYGLDELSTAGSEWLDIRWKCLLPR
jgi:hypothetical protein